MSGKKVKWAWTHRLGLWVLAAALMPAIGAAQHAVAQTAGPAADASRIPVYDVVSIKPNKTGGGGTSISIDDGNFEATNVSFRNMVQNAYGLKEAQLLNLPPWARSARFDIRAKIVEPDQKLLDSLTPEQRRSMLQAILLERFQLKSHRETKVLPVYELVVAKDGPKFKASQVKQGDGKTVNGLNAGSVRVRNTNLSAVGVSLEALANQLSSSAQRMVVDKTGLKGEYDFELRWSPDDGAPADADAPPALFTALQEQLGLRLEPAKASVETFVVDHAEMPVED